MPIPVHREPDHWSAWDAESCCFCHELTNHWTTLPDRPPGEQVACCTDCAATFDADVVPNKNEWIDYHCGLDRTARRAHGGA